MKILVASCQFVVMMASVLAFLGGWTHSRQAQAGDAADPVDRKAETERQFRKEVTPFIKRYCISCHSNRRPTEAGVNFSPALKAPGHAAFTEQWKQAVARVKAHDMPPEYDEQPSEEERQMFIDWQADLKYLSEKDPGPFVIRRLTKTEYGNTLRDLFGVDPEVVDSLPDEVSGAGYLNSLSQLQLEQYLAIADRVSDQVISKTDESPTEMQQQLFGEPPDSNAEIPETVRSVAERLAAKIYRRPASEVEIETLIRVFDLGRKNDLEYPQAMRLMLKAMLVSPQFLFITPSTDVDSDSAIVPLDDYQLASRLSYFLWATMPDDELMTLADRGTLHEEAVLETQVVRMLRDPRSRALFDGFGAQWLGVADLATKTFDKSLFPEMNQTLRRAMYDEVRLFFDSIVQENQSVVTFITSDYTFLNESLASIYGMDDTVTGPEMRRVKLTNQNRGGILGMPATLASTSFPNRTSAVKRGVWVLEQVLGDQVPAAPPNVPELAGQDQATIENLTLRERTELHRTNPVCANCHKLLDPIGFGLENFDAIGRWRDNDDNGAPIDASGELPGEKRFSSPKQLKAIIAMRSDAFSRNLVERLLAYALCRNLEGYDEIVVDDLMNEISADGYRMQTIVQAVVTSYPFTHRRVTEE